MRGKRVNVATADGQLVDKNKEVNVTLAQLNVLMINALLAVAEGAAEHEATDSTLEELHADMHRASSCTIKIKHLAELLYLANMREENKEASKFWSPKTKQTFDQFVTSLFNFVRVSGLELKFDKDTNTVLYSVKGGRR